MREKIAYIYIPKYSSINNPMSRIAFPFTDEETLRLTE